jgi:hypothetical protein
VARAASRSSIGTCASASARAACAALRILRFPFDPALRGRGDLANVAVQRLEGEGPEIEERYQCTAAGTFEVTLAVLDDGFSRTFRIARQAPQGA